MVSQQQLQQVAQVVELLVQEQLVQQQPQWAVHLFTMLPQPLEEW